MKYYMSEQKFQPGDVVKLKSGGPSMTVEFIIFSDTVNLYEKAVCSWFMNHDHKRETFASASLEVLT